LQYCCRLKAPAFHALAPQDAFRCRGARQTIQIVRPLESIADTQPQLQLDALSLSAKDLQPERFEQSHAQDVLMFVSGGDVVKENSF
jgi:hypothetical protein